jgi:site-specific DNA recombinase
MTPTHAVRKGRRYRYYVSTALITAARSLHEKGLRVPAGDVEALVLDRIRAFFASEEDVGETLSNFGLDAATLRALLKNADELV